MGTVASSLTGCGAALEERVRRIGRTDVAVAIPSFNDARTIGNLVRVAVEGLRRHLPDVKAVVVVCDGGSTDATAEVAARADVGGLTDLFVDACAVAGGRACGGTGLAALPGQASALRAVFPVLAALEVRAACVVPGGGRGVTPERLLAFLHPVLAEGYDLVAPRDLHLDGAMASTLVCPLTRALFGRRIRPPLGSGFGLSGRLLSRLLPRVGEHGRRAPFGVSLALTTSALAEGFRVGEAALGARFAERATSVSDLVPALAEVVSVLFSQMERYEAAWRDVRGSYPVPCLGPPATEEPVPATVPAGSLTGVFRRAALDLGPVWTSFLSGRTIGEIRAAAASRVPRLTDATWVAVVAEAAAGFHRARIPADVLARALVPLYLGKLASLAAEEGALEPGGVDDRLEALALAFEHGKEALVACWDGRPS